MKTIEINNLTKYYGKTLGIKDVNFSIEQGEIFGFIGPNGAGKSTTIRTLLNLIFPTSGSASIFGLDIIKDSPEIKKRTGYLPAEGNYYHEMTVRELFDYSASFFDIANYQARLNYLAEAFDLDLIRNIRDLSTGNKKKVSIVQSLLHSPKLLILDEPTSGLDPLVQSAFYEILREENNRGATIFLSSHVLSEVQKICSRVGIIRNGEIIKVESIDNLKKNLLKRIRIVFKNGLPGEFDPPGAIKSEKNENSAQFMFEGDLNELLAYISNFEIENLLIEDPTLEEIFLHFYEN